MPSDLGNLLRARRQELGLSLRELAGRVEKSPPFIVSLELEDEFPAAAEETLRSIAAVLDLDPDTVITMAGKVPGDVMPQSATDVYLYRAIQALEDEEKNALLKRLTGKEDT